MTVRRCGLAERQMPQGTAAVARRRLLAQMALQRQSVLVMSMLVQPAQTIAVH